MGVSEKTVRPAAAEVATKEAAAEAATNMRQATTEAATKEAAAEAATNMRPATTEAATKEAAAEVATKEAAAEAATNMRQATTEAATKEAAAEAATNMRQAAGTAPMPEQAAAGAAAPVRPQEDPLETNPLETNPLELIPQRPPMVLVDRFEGIDAEGVSTTGYTVVPAGLFVAGGRMSECGIIEHMAQSAAARIGWCCRAEGRPVPVGFIGAVSRLELHDLPRTGAHLRTRLRIVQEIGPLSLAEVRTEADGRPLAEGNLKIYLQS